MSKRTIVRRPAEKGATKQGRAKPESMHVDGEEQFWQQMYIISERWNSDLTFFNDELDFFRKLIDKYFMRLIDEKNIESTLKLATDLAKFEKRSFTILQRLNHHLRHLTNLFENPFSHDVRQCKDEHGQLEELLAPFTKDFRKIKKEVFSVTEHVMDSEKARHLLNGR
jgi:hypothetical protein